MAELTVIVLAFANDQEGNRYLRNLREELRQLRAILEPAQEKGLCKLVVLPDAILDEIFKAFTEHPNRVAILHYGGHAGGDRLFLESTGTEGAVAHAEGLATFLGQRRNLQLVFLNGCSTRAQAAGLLDAGVTAVIATARAIEDAIALEFAAAFYSELASGATLRTAYEASRGRVLAGRGSAPQAYFRTRDLGTTDHVPVDPADDRGFPWELRLAPGAELDGRWSLPEAVGNPLFGLPAPSVELAAGDSVPRPPAVHPRRVGRVLRPGPGHPRDLQPRHRPRHPAGDPLLWSHGRGQVVGARRRPGATAGAFTRGALTSGATPTWACWAPCAADWPRAIRGRTQARPSTSPGSGSIASAPTGRWS